MRLVLREVFSAGLGSPDLRQAGRHGAGTWVTVESGHIGYNLEFEFFKISFWSAACCSGVVAYG